MQAHQGRWPAGRRRLGSALTKSLPKNADGLLDPAAKVADLIPEFATNGKDVITLEQVMLHTSGFPHAPMAPSLWQDRAGRLERFASWRLNWEPGTRFVPD